MIISQTELFLPYLFSDHKNKIFPQRVKKNIPSLGKDFLVSM